MFASGIPFTWQPPGESTSYPWFDRLFDTNYWSSAVDRFFNLLLVVVTAWFLLLRPLLSLIGLKKGTRGLKRIRTGVIALTTVLAVAQQFGAPFLNSSAPYQN